MQPEIHYTDGDPQIAYQVAGDGDLDLVFAFDWAGNVELIWQHPSIERFLRRLASFSRLVLFDTRGMGCTISRRGSPAAGGMDGRHAPVMDPVGSERAAILGHGHAGALAALSPPRTPSGPRRSS